MLERPVAAVQPAPDVGRVRLAELDDRPAPILGILAAPQQLVLLEVAHELARRRERQAELARQVAHGARALGGHVGEDGDVAAAEAGLPVDQAQQLG